MILTGEGQTRYERARLAAENQLRKAGELDTVKNTMGEFVSGMAGADARTGREKTIDTELWTQLQIRAQAKGIDIASKYPAYGQLFHGNATIPWLAKTTSSLVSEGDRARLFNQISDDIDDPAKLIQQAGQNLLNAAGQMRQPAAPQPGVAPGGFNRQRPGP